VNPAVLGLRLVRGSGRRGLARLTLTLVGTAIGVACLLQVLSLPIMLGARSDRAAQRFPSRIGGPVRGWFEQFELRVGGELVKGFEIGSDRLRDGSPLPPGLRSYPQSGEAYVSPTLLSELQRNDALAATFDAKVVGLVQPEGLVSPNELFAWVGTHKADLPGGGRPFNGFGVAWNPEPDLPSESATAITLMLIGLIGVPLLVYFAICARLSAEVRDRRLAALRLVGMTKSETGRASSIESAAAGAGGALLGAIAFSIASPSIAALGFGGLVWFPRDARLPPILLAFVCVVVVVGASLVARIGAASAIRGALTFRRIGPPRRMRLLRVVPLIVGVGILVGLIGAKEFLPRTKSLGDATIYLQTGLILAGVGLPLGIPIVMTGVASILADRTHHLPVQLGARRLQIEPGGPVRVVAGIVTVVFLMGFATGILRVAQVSSASLSGTEFLSVAAGDFDKQDRPRLLTLDGVQATAAAVTSSAEIAEPGAPPRPENIPVTAIFADCRSFETLAQESVPECLPGESFRVKIGELLESQRDLRPGERLSFPITSDNSPETADLSVPSREIHVDSGGVLSVDLLYPLEMLPGGRVPETAEIYFASATTASALDSLVAKIARLRRSAEIFYLNDNLAMRIQAETFENLLRSALLLGSLVGFGAFAVAAIDRVAARRAELTALTIAGVPRRILRYAQAVQTTLPLIVGLAAAFALGKLAEQATVVVSGVISEWSWDGLGLSLLIGLVCTCAVVLGSVVAIPSRIDPGLIRRE
jgi:hypothetical protein